MRDIERQIQAGAQSDLPLHIQRSIDLVKHTKLFRSDAYRWIAAWIPPRQPVNIFLSPPFSDLTDKSEDLITAVQRLKDKVPEDSIIVLQSELGSPLGGFPRRPV